MTPTPSDAAAFPGAVLLDMDGTLTDSEKWWFRGEAELLAEYGVEWTEELAKEVVGCPIDWWASTMVERFGLPAPRTSPATWWPESTASSPASPRSGAPAPASSSSSWPAWPSRRPW